MGESAMQINETKTIETDILIIGGGTAGCYAALTIAEQSDYSVVIAEKANIWNVNTEKEYHEQKNG